MRFPFLAAEYTNICAFATFSKSSAVELLTGQKFCGPAGGLRAPVRCAARAWRPCPPPSRRTPRLCGSRFPGLRLRGPPVLAGAARRRSVQDTATPVAFGLPAMNVYTFPHLANCKHSGLVRSGSRGCPQSYPFLADARCGSVRTRIGLQDMYPVARSADRACTPHPVRLESDRRETRLRAALRSPIGAAYELVS